MGVGFLWGMMKNQDSFHREGQSTDANGTMAKLVEISTEAFKEVLIQMVQKATENSNFPFSKWIEKLKFQQIKIQKLTEKKKNRTGKQNDWWAQS